MNAFSSMVLTDLLRSQPDVLITADFSDVALARLRELGTVRLFGWAAGEWFVPAEAFKSAMRSADVLVAGYEPVTAELIDASPRLRLIASIRSEPRTNVDVDAATARGIPVLRTVGRTDHAVAEFTVAALLTMVRNIVPAVSWMRERPDDFVASDAFFRETVWGDASHAPQLRFTGVELHGKTLGLVGLGSIGRAVVQKASGFGLRIVAFDPNLQAKDVEGLDIDLISLEQLLSESDFVSLHARLTPLSRGLLGRREFEQMRAGAYLANTARAALVDRDALLDALDSGRLAGAALDVFDVEPPSADDELIRHPRVLPTPHIAAWTAELTDHHSRSIADELVRIAGGAMPAQITNPEVLAGNPAVEPRAVGGAGR